MAVVRVMPRQKGSVLDAECEVGSVGHRAQGCLRATVVAKAGRNVGYSVVPSCVFSV